MDVERVYQPDVESQIQAIALLLGIRLPARTVSNENTLSSDHPPDTPPKQLQRNTSSGAQEHDLQTP